MWSIKHATKDDCKYNLLAESSYIVGRKQAQILLADDPSISRQHAALTVFHNEDNIGDPSKSSILKLKDTGSKYGTFKNDVKLGNDEEVKLAEGDIVKFGQFDNVYHVCFTRLVVTTSCFTPTNVVELKKIIRRLGGHVVPEWRPCCTHLVMAEVKITLKALCCMLDLKPLVTGEYFICLLKFFMPLVRNTNSPIQSTNVPEAKNYLPPVSEPLIDKDKASFVIIPERKILFESKTFLFLEYKQMKKFYLAITSAGGNATLINKSSGVDVDNLTRQGFSVVQPSAVVNKDSELSAFLKELTAVLHSKKKRLIPESDFGFAVAYCSTEKFCNPDFDLGSNLLGLPKIPSQTYTEEEVYVADTDEVTQRRKRARLEQLSSVKDGMFAIPGPSSSKTGNGTAKEAITDSEGNGSDKKRKHSSSTSCSSDEASSKGMPLKKIKAESPSGNFGNAVASSNDQQSLFSSLSVKTERKTPVQSKIISSYSNNNNQTLDAASTDFTIQAESRNPRVLRSDEKLNKPSTSTFSTICFSNQTTNGFHSTRKVNESISALNGDPDGDLEDLPRNLIKIEIADLVKHRPPPTPLQSSTSTLPVKNFKRFKKVQHVGSHTSLPRIIGVHELVPHNSGSRSRAIDEWLQENRESNVADTNPDDFGEFDWPTQSRSSRRRR